MCHHGAMQGACTGPGRAPSGGAGAEVNSHVHGPSCQAATGGPAQLGPPTLTLQGRYVAPRGATHDASAFSGDEHPGAASVEAKARARVGCPRLPCHPGLGDPPLRWPFPRHPQGTNVAPFTARA